VSPALSAALTAGKSSILVRLEPLAATASFSVARIDALSRVA
jgi:hypothetical protein